MSRRTSLVALLSTVVFVAAAVGQIPSPTGNLFGQVSDEQARSLSGVTITLTGPGAPQTVSTDANGAFRFLHLSPGAYSIVLARVGFETARREVAVALGKNAVLAVTLSVAGATEEVTVGGQSFAVDSRKTETGANFSAHGARRHSHDAGSLGVLRQVPGRPARQHRRRRRTELQQPTFVGKGSHPDQNTYNLDGVAVSHRRRHAALLRLRFARQHRDRDRRLRPVAVDPRRDAESRHQARHQPVPRLGPRALHRRRPVGLRRRSRRSALEGSPLALGRRREQLLPGSDVHPAGRGGHSRTRRRRTTGTRSSTRSSSPPIRSPSRSRPSKGTPTGGAPPRTAPSRRRGTTRFPAQSFKVEDSQVLSPTLFASARFLVPENATDQDAARRSRRAGGYRCV